ncbi:MAG: lipid A export permease/ATP-binding protein MsbA [Kangiellaceae bacterium]|jgi:subfamily B ATP-binding cassette protein MsbA|nr:lipid A export permease/ATP-binding protein MsbA [Kangiellaceae bacterium]
MAKSGQKSGWKIYSRLLGYTRRYWPVFLFGILCTAVVALIEVFLIAQFKPLIDDLFDSQNISSLRLVPYIIVGVVIVRSIASFFSVYCMEWVGRQIVHELRIDLFRKYLYLPLNYFDQSNQGDLVSRVTFNTETVSTATTQAVTNLVKSLAGIIAAITFMFRESPTLTLTFLLAAPVIAIVVNSAAKRFRRISHNMQDSMGLVTQVTNEMVDGVRVVKTFGAQDSEYARFSKVSNINRQQFLKMVVVKSFSSGFILFLAGAGMAVVFYVAIEEFINGTLTRGAFVAFFMQVMYLLKPLKDLSNVNNILQKGIAGAESIFNQVDKEDEVNNGTKKIGTTQGGIEFKNIDFSYSDNQKIIRDFSLTVKPGQTIALVGPSGSGKSTITNLLLKFYQPQSGQIFLDGVDINELELNNYRQQIAYVSQNIILFNDSIKANIAFGELQNANDDAIAEAVEHAYLTDIVEQLDDGLDTQIGNSGSKLSGGQRQRVAIARALLKNAPVLILDEATSALDNESEKKIQKALDYLIKDRTTIVIAHRLSTVENADLIVVLKDGRIVEQGSHSELMAKDGEFKKLYNLQFSE